MLRLGHPCILICILCCNYVDTQCTPATLPHTTDNTITLEPHTQQTYKTDLENDETPPQTCSDAQEQLKAKEISVAGNDDQIYDIMKELQDRHADKEVIVVIYIYKNEKLTLLGRVPTSYQTLEEILNKYHHHFCIHEDKLHRLEEAHSGWCVDDLIIIPNHKESLILKHVLDQHGKDIILNNESDDSQENNNEIPSAPYQEDRGYNNIVDQSGNVSNHPKYHEFRFPSQREMAFPPINAHFKGDYKDNPHELGSRYRKDRERYMKVKGPIESNFNIDSSNTNNLNSQTESTQHINGKSDDRFMFNTNQEPGSTSQSFPSYHFNFKPINYIVPPHVINHDIPTPDLYRFHNTKLWPNYVSNFKISNADTSVQFKDSITNSYPIGDKLTKFGIKDNSWPSHQFNFKPVNYKGQHHFANFYNGNNYAKIQPNPTTMPPNNFYSNNYDKNYKSSEPMFKSIISNHEDAKSYYWVDNLHTGQYAGYEPYNNVYDHNPFTENNAYVYDSRGQSYSGSNIQFNVNVPSTLEKSFIDRTKPRSEFTIGQTYESKNQLYYGPIHNYEGPAILQSTFSGSSKQMNYQLISGDSSKSSVQYNPNIFKPDSKYQSYNSNYNINQHILYAPPSSAKSGTVNQSPNYISNISKLDSLQMPYAQVTPSSSQIHKFGMIDRDLKSTIPQPFSTQHINQNKFYSTVPQTYYNPYNIYPTPIYHNFIGARQNKFYYKPAEIAQSINMYKTPNTDLKVRVPESVNVPQNSQIETQVYGQQANNEAAENYLPIIQPFYKYQPKIYPHQLVQNAYASKPAEQNVLPQTYNVDRTIAISKPIPPEIHSIDNTLNLNKPLSIQTERQVRYGQQEDYKTNVPYSPIVQPFYQYQPNVREHPQQFEQNTYVPKQSRLISLPKTYNFDMNMYKYRPNSVSTLFSQLKTNDPPEMYNTEQNHYINTPINIPQNRQIESQVPYGKPQLLQNAFIPKPLRQDKVPLSTQSHNFDIGMYKYRQIALTKPIPQLKTNVPPEMYNIQQDTLNFNEPLNTPQHRQIESQMYYGKPESYEATVPQLPNIQPFNQYQQYKSKYPQRFAQNLYVTKPPINGVLPQIYNFDMSLHKNRPVVISKPITQLKTDVPTQMYIPNFPDYITQQYTKPKTIPMNGNNVWIRPNQIKPISNIPTTRYETLGSQKNIYPQKKFVTDTPFSSYTKASNNNIQSYQIDPDKMESALPQNYVQINQGSQNKLLSLNFKPTHFYCKPIEINLKSMTPYYQKQRVLPVSDYKMERPSSEVSPISKTNIVDPTLDSMSNIANIEQTKPGGVSSDYNQPSTSYPCLNSAHSVPFKTSLRSPISYSYNTRPWYKEFDSRPKLKSISPSVGPSNTLLQDTTQTTPYNVFPNAVHPSKNLKIPILHTPVPHIFQIPSPKTQLLRLNKYIPKSSVSTWPLPSSNYPPNVVPSANQPGKYFLDFSKSTPVSSDSNTTPKYTSLPSAIWPLASRGTLPTLNLQNPSQTLANQPKQYFVDLQTPPEISNLKPKPIKWPTYPANTFQYSSRVIPQSPSRSAAAYTKSYSFPRISSSITKNIEPSQTWPSKPSQVVEPFSDTFSNSEAITPLARNLKTPKSKTDWSNPSMYVSPAVRKPSLSFSNFDHSYKSPDNSSSNIKSKPIAEQPYIKPGLLKYPSNVEPKNPKTYYFNSPGYPKSSFAPSTKTIPHQSLYTTQNFLKEPPNTTSVKTYSFPELSRPYIQKPQTPIEYASPTYKPSYFSVHPQSSNFPEYANFISAVVNKPLIHPTALKYPQTSPEFPALQTKMLSPSISMVEPSSENTPLAYSFNLAPTSYPSRPVLANALPKTISSERMNFKPSNRVPAYTLQPQYISSQLPSYTVLQKPGGEILPTKSTPAYPKTYSASYRPGYYSNDQPKPSPYTVSIPNTQPKLTSLNLIKSKLPAPVFPYVSSNNPKYLPWVAVKSDTTRYFYQPYELETQKLRTFETTNKPQPSTNKFVPVYASPRTILALQLPSLSQTRPISTFNRIQTPLQPSFLTKAYSYDGKPNLSTRPSVTVHDLPRPPQNMATIYPVSPKHFKDDITEGNVSPLNIPKSTDVRYNYIHPKKAIPPFEFNLNQYNNIPPLTKTPTETINHKANLWNPVTNSQNIFKDTLYKYKENNISPNYNQYFRYQTPTNIENSYKYPKVSAKISKGSLQQFKPTVSIHPYPNSDSINPDILKQVPDNAPYINNGIHNQVNADPSNYVNWQTTPEIKQPYSYYQSYNDPQQATTENIQKISINLGYQNKYDITHRIPESIPMKQDTSKVLPPYNYNTPRIGNYKLFNVPPINLEIPKGQPLSDISYQYHKQFKSPQHINTDTITQLNKYKTTINNPSFYATNQNIGSYTLENPQTYSQKPKQYNEGYANPVNWYKSRSNVVPLPSVEKPQVKSTFKSYTPTPLMSIPYNTIEKNYPKIPNQMNFSPKSAPTSSEKVYGNVTPKHYNHVPNYKPNARENYDTNANYKLWPISDKLVKEPSTITNGESILAVTNTIISTPGVVHNYRPEIHISKSQDTSNKPTYKNDYTNTNVWPRSDYNPINSLSKINTPYAVSNLNKIPDQYASYYPPNLHKSIAIATGQRPYEHSISKSTVLLSGPSYSTSKLSAFKSFPKTSLPLELPASYSISSQFPDTLPSSLLNTGILNPLPSNYRVKTVPSFPSSSNANTSPTVTKGVTSFPPSSYSLTKSPTVETTTEIPNIALKSPYTYKLPNKISSPVIPISNIMQSPIAGYRVKTSPIAFSPSSTSYVTQPEHSISKGMASYSPASFSISKTPTFKTISKLSSPSTLPRSPFSAYIPFAVPLQTVNPYSNYNAVQSGSFPYSPRSNTYASPEKDSITKETASYTPAFVNVSRLPTFKSPYMLNSIPSATVQSSSLLYSPSSNTYPFPEKDSITKGTASYTPAYFSVSRTPSLKTMSDLSSPSTLPYSPLSPRILSAVPSESVNPYSNYYAVQSSSVPYSPSFNVYTFPKKDSITKGTASYTPASVSVEKTPTFNTMSDLSSSSTSSKMPLSPYILPTVPTATVNPYSNYYAVQSKSMPYSPSSDVFTPPEKDSISDGTASYTPASYSVEKTPTLKTMSDLSSLSTLPYSPLSPRILSAVPSESVNPFSNYYAVRSGSLPYSPSSHVFKFPKKDSITKGTTSYTPASYSVAQTPTFKTMSDLSSPSTSSRMPSSPYILPTVPSATVNPYCYNYAVRSGSMPYSPSFDVFTPPKKDLTSKGTASYTPASLTVSRIPTFKTISDSSPSLLPFSPLSSYITSAVPSALTVNPYSNYYAVPSSSFPYSLSSNVITFPEKDLITKGTASYTPASFSVARTPTFKTTSDLSSPSTSSRMPSSPYILPTMPSASVDPYSYYYAVRSGSMPYSPSSNVLTPPEKDSISKGTASYTPASLTVSRTPTFKTISDSSPSLSPFSPLSSYINSAVPSATVNPYSNYYAVPSSSFPYSPSSNTYTSPEKVLITKGTASFTPVSVSVAKTPTFKTMSDLSSPSTSSRMPSSPYILPTMPSASVNPYFNFYAVPSSPVPYSPSFNTYTSPEKDSISKGTASYTPASISVSRLPTFETISANNYSSPYILPSIPSATDQSGSLSYSPSSNVYTTLEKDSITKGTATIRPGSLSILPMPMTKPTDIPLYSSPDYTSPAKLPNAVQTSPLSKIDLKKIPIQFDSAYPLDSYSPCVTHPANVGPYSNLIVSPGKYSTTIGTAEVIPTSFTSKSSIPSTNLDITMQSPLPSELSVPSSATTSFSYPCGYNYKPLQHQNYLGDYVNKYLPRGAYTSPDINPCADDSNNVGITNYLKAKMCALNNLKQNVINNYNTIVDKLLKEKTVNIGNVCLVKYPSDTKKIELVPTKNPRVFMKLWKSKIKVIKAKVVLDETEYDVTNFMPVVKEPDVFNFDAVQDLVKDIVSQKYGDPIVLKGVYSMYKPYAVTCNIDDIKLNSGGRSILWPTLDESMIV